MFSLHREYAEDVGCEIDWDENKDDEFILSVATLEGRMTLSYWFRILEGGYYHGGIDHSDRPTDTHRSVLDAFHHDVLEALGLLKKPRVCA